MIQYTTSQHQQRNTQGPAKAGLAPQRAQQQVHQSDGCQVIEPAPRVFKNRAKEQIDWGGR